MVALLSALALSIILSPWFIKKLKQKQIGQQVRDDGPKSHFSKKGTPTMGGALILFSAVTASLLWVDLNNNYIWLSLIILVGFGFIGFLDDYLKISKKNPKGL